MADISSLVNDALLEPLRKTRQWRTLTTPLETGGLGIRRSKWQKRRTLFHWELEYATQAELDAFVAFFDARKGGRGSFDWTPLAAHDGGGPYTCVFAADELEAIYEGPEEFGCTVAVLAVEP